MTPSLPVEYVVPLRWDTPDPSAECDFAEYLASLAPWVDITIVDGSPQLSYQRHSERWARYARQIPPAEWPGRNGKVAGVVTGVRAARHPRVIVADDDVRYRPGQLVAIAAALQAHHVVRPQNVFEPAPWHARWDTARSLINLATGQDYPGTLGLSRDFFLEMGGYDGDVLFENLQLLRTFRAAGGRELALPRLAVPRRPPDARTFWRQRVRQAYDDFAQPPRLAWELLWLPGMALAAFRRPSWLLAAAGAAIVLAEAGRHRGGRESFPVSAAAWAPCWVVERSLCVWLAVGARALGGVQYRGRRMRWASRPVSPGVAPLVRTVDAGLPRG